MKKLTPTQRAYIAGIIDGEGTLSIVHQRGEESNRYAVTFRVCNTDKNLLDWMVKTTGIGKVTLLPVSKRSETWDRPNIKPLYGWYINANSARWLLPQIKRYLIVKKEQAEITEEWLKRNYHHGSSITDEENKWKRTMCARMKLLNHRGIY